MNKDIASLREQINDIEKRITNIEVKLGKTIKYDGAEYQDTKKIANDCLVKIEKLSSDVKNAKKTIDKQGSLIEKLSNIAADTSKATSNLDIYFKNSEKTLSKLSKTVESLNEKVSNNSQSSKEFKFTKKQLLGAIIAGIIGLFFSSYVGFLIRGNESSNEGNNNNKVEIEERYEKHC